MVRYPSGLSPRTDARRNIVAVPLVIPEIFQGRQFGVAVSQTQFDGSRQSLFDIDPSDRTVGGGGAMTGDQTALHFLISNVTPMEQVRGGPISRFRPDVRPDSIHEIRRLRRVGDGAVI